MYALTIRFALPPETDWEEARARQVRRAWELFRDVPGLRSKGFVFSPERSEVGGNYVFETQDDAEAYLRSELWRATVARLGDPRVERAELSAYVECGDLVYPPYDEASARASPSQPAAP